MQLRSGMDSGFTTKGNNLIIENVTMNDHRNDTEYQCVIVPMSQSHPTIGDIVSDGDTTTLYVAGEYFSHKYEAIHR